MNAYFFSRCRFVFALRLQLITQTSFYLSFSIDNFQPESVDKSRPGGLVGNGETYELEFSGHGSSSGSTDQTHASTSLSSMNGGGAETYSWTSAERTGRPVDCILIFDEETQVRRHPTGTE